MGNFQDAYRALLERELVCPKCGSDNKDSRHIELTKDGALCNTCATAWQPEPRSKV